MTLDEAIKRYTDNAEYERTHGNLQGCLEFKQLAEWLKELKQLKEQTRWIPVSERLPEDYTDVIATVKEHYKDEIGYFVFPQARYSKEYGWEWPYEAGTDYWTGLNGVVAWMPLPEPYKASPTGAERSDKE